jgi:conjugative relaxase-like TrwC/TraI family protein
MVALVKGEQLVFEAHEAAVRATMDYVEKNCIFTRTGKGGVFRQQTDNATSAIFPHYDNRNNEPQMHTHCVIFNQTIGADGKWRSMDNRELYQQKMTIGMVYHHELGRRLKELGYQLEWNHDGTFEIVGYTQQQLEAFNACCRLWFNLSYMSIAIHLSEEIATFPR